ncbi:MAG: ABC transporter ATP-binding protein [Bacteriovoracaceae bacterium]
MALIELKNINKKFKMGDETIHALKDINFSIKQGEFLSIIGSSGSGKTTLMNIIGLLDLPESGEYLLDNVNIKNMNDDEMAHLRNQNIGFIFQNFYLLPKVSALKNVEMPLYYSTIYNKSLTATDITEKAISALNTVKLQDRIHHKPNELSGGQRQRVAIARALANNPKILLCDEPTGALDSKTGEDIINLFRELNHQGVTVILITHDLKIAEKTERVVTIADGKLVG